LGDYSEILTVDAILLSVVLKIKKKAVRNCRGCFQRWLTSLGCHPP